jgi:hypothetical protein
MANSRVSHDGKGKTLYIELNIYPNSSNPRKNLTVSCPDQQTRFKTTLSAGGLERLRVELLRFYDEMVLSKQSTAR